MIQVGGGGGPEWPTDAPEGEGGHMPEPSRQESDGNIVCAPLTLGCVHNFSPTPISIHLRA